MSIRFNYNAPVILTFALISAVVYVLLSIFGNNIQPFFSLDSHFNYKDPVDYLSMVTYTFGHQDIDHLLGNMSLLLLLGPVVEEKYGWQRLLGMMLITAIVTAIFQLLLFNSGLWGASGLVFMLIILISFVNVKDGKIPITFVLVLVLFIGRELYMGFIEDNVSQFAHIIGGVCGSLFGFTKGLRSL